MSTMSYHQCPKCELRFTWHTELDDHCRNDHPEFHHDYPVQGVRHYATAPDPAPPAPAPPPPATNAEPG
jgi:hypothetical protein